MPRGWGQRSQPRGPWVAQHSEWLCVFGDGDQGPPFLLRGQLPTPL